MATRLLVGVDSPIMRVGLEHTLALSPAVDIVGWAEHPLGLVEQVRKGKPDVIVSFFNSLRAATETAQAVPDTPVLAVATVRREEDVLDALRSGIRGLLDRTCTAEQVVEAVELLSRGLLAYPYGWERTLLDRLERVSAWTQRKTEEALALTNRESEVLALLLDGHSVKQVASRLGIALQTAKNHIHHLMVKTGSSSRVELVTWAMRQGFRPSSLEAPPANGNVAEEEHGANGRLGDALNERIHGTRR